MDRRKFLKFSAQTAAGVILGAPWLREVFALGEDSRFRFASLKLGKGWNCRAGASRGLLYELELRTSVRINFEPVALKIEDKNLFDHPLLFLCGDKAFELPTAKNLKRLETFLRYGGMLVADSATGKTDDGFDRSVRKLAAALLPEKKLEKLPFSQTLYKSFYRIRRVAGRLAVKPFLEGISLEDRTVFLYSMNDLHGAWSADRLGQWSMQPMPGGESQRQLALAVGVNIAIYALTVNYKSDQVHTTYRLRRRFGPW